MHNDARNRSPGMDGAVKPIPRRGVVLVYSEIPTWPAIPCRFMRLCKGNCLFDWCHAYPFSCWINGMLIFPKQHSGEPSRSEERRVGKECRSRRSAYQAKKATRNIKM